MKIKSIAAMAALSFAVMACNQAAENNNEASPEVNANAQTQSQAPISALEAGKKFLAENAQKEGVVTTASGLQYKVVDQGTGPKPSANAQVEVHYHGTTIDGKVFDSSVDRGVPITFGLNQVIKGWQEGLQLMPLGSKYMLYIPSELAYGPNSPTPAIAPNSVLVFEVELLNILQ